MRSHLKNSNSAVVADVGSLPHPRPLCNEAVFEMALREKEIISMPSIRSTIDVDFLEKLNALGRGSSSTGAALVQSIKGGEATESRVRKGLRSGAQYYAKALNGINYVGSLVNYARQDLEEMQKLTTSMAAFAEEASKEGTGTQRRRTLNRQFFSAAKRFLEINENAESNGENI